MAAECRPNRAERDLGTTRPDLDVARLAAAQWGVVSARELRECGIRGNAVTARVRRGWLHKIHRRVYAVGHDNLPLEGRFLAAVKACGEGAALSHVAAAAHFGLVRWDGRAIEVTVTGAHARVHRGVNVHRTAQLGPPDIGRHERIPITSPARTIVDLAASLDERRLRRAVRQSQSLRLVDLRQLTEVLGRLGRRRGISKLAEILASGPAPTRSELEDVVLDLLLAGGLEHPNVNEPLVLDGREIVPDFRWPEQHLVVEADGAAWHDHKLAREHDAERQALLEAHGERVLRVTWDQAITQPRQTLARITAAGAPPRDRVSSKSR